MSIPFEASEVEAERKRVCDPLTSNLQRLFLFEASEVEAERKRVCDPLISNIYSFTLTSGFTRVSTLLLRS